MKKTIKKRAFVSAIAMLIVSAIVLTSSTFAWFSMSKEATVEKMDLTVSSPEGIQISANAAAWGASLTQEELFDEKSTSRYKAYEGNNNLDPLNLIPVSSAFATNTSAGGAVDFFKVVLNDQKKATVTRIDQTAGKDDEAGILAFDLFFKVANDTTVYFGSSEFEDTSKSDILTALRVGFVMMGNTDSTEASAATGMKGLTGSYLYEVDSVNRSADALASGATTGEKSTGYLESTAGNGDTIQADFTIINGTRATKGTLIRDTAASDSKCFNLKAGVTKVRVYIWVEGNDVDCRNSVAGAALTAALKFTIK